MAEKTKGSGKKYIFAGILVAVIAVVIIAVTSYPPSEEDVSGAIGAAKKYRAEQISESDVLLDNPELQELLQNDQVLALLQDEEFRRIIASDDFGKLVENQAAVEAVAKGVIDKIGQHSRTAPLLFNLDYARASADKTTLRLANLSMLSSKFSEDPQAKALVVDNTALLKSMEDGRFPHITRNYSCLLAICDGTASRLISSQPALMALFDPSITSMFMRGDYDGAFSDPAIAKYVEGTALDRARREPVLQDFLAKAQADGILAEDGVMALLGNELFVDAMLNRKSRSLVFNENFLQLAAAPSFIKAAHDNPLELKADPARFKIENQLQSLAKDVASNAQALSLITDTEVNALFDLSSVRKLLSLSMFRNVAESPHGMTSLVSMSKIGAFAKAAHDDAELAALFTSNSDVLKLVADPNSSKLIKDHLDVFYAMGTDEEMVSFCSHADALHALSDNAPLFTQGMFSKAFATDRRLDFVRQMSLAKEAEDAAAVKLATDAIFQAAATDPNVARLRASDLGGSLKALYDFSKLNGLSGFSRIVQNGDLARACAAHGFVTTFQKAHNRNVVDTEPFARLVAKLTEDTSL